MYSSQVLDHFQNPRHSGELPDADINVTVENPACGDVLQLSLKLDGDRIAQCRFRTRGCVTAIACSSYLAEQLPGKSLVEANVIRREQIVAALGGLTNETMHGSHLAFDGLQAALKIASKR
jgi:nitrogen fixation NifU-like protein